MGPAIYNQAHIPGGLHLSCGLGGLETRNANLGEISSNGPLVSALLTPKEGLVFDTKVKAGPVQSFGLHLSHSALQQDDPIVQDLLKRVQEKPLLALEENIARKALRLSAPIDPWFQADAKTLILQSRGLELMAIILSALDQDKLEAHKDQHNRIAYNVRDQIDADLSITLSLDSLARSHGTNPRTLTEAFKTAFGESISIYLTRKRMEYAMILLCEGACVAFTAEQVGYQPTAFSTAFKRHFGVPPSHIKMKSKI